MIKAVIFDMDGVLIDTEKHYFSCWIQASKEAGFPFTKEQALSLRSCDAKIAEKRMKEIFGEEFDYYAIRERRRQLVKETLEQCGLEMKPEVEETLKLLREKGIKIAVATATPLDRTREHLTQLGIMELFDSIVSAKEVEHGKPAPDVYLYACEQIGEKPEHCIAVEDSPNGILSAYRAGLKPVMVPDLTQPDEELKLLLFGCVNSLSGVCHIIDNFVSEE
ncbi:MAG: HAD family phosphatase [Lachnospiraceae bacterium]|nr:HAD family phosphatase [Lachnospiraceae bacterium]